MGLGLLGTDLLAHLYGGCCSPDPREPGIWQGSGRLSAVLGSSCKKGAVFVSTRAGTLMGLVSPGPGLEPQGRGSVWLTLVCLAHVLEPTFQVGARFVGPGSGGSGCLDQVPFLLER